MTQSRKHLVALILFSLISILLISNAYGEKLRVVKPEEVGLSEERLNRIDNVMQQHADDKIIPGAVILIARHGKIAHLCPNAAERRKI